MPDAPKILLVDIETLPNVGFCWGKYEQNILDYTQEFCIATFAAKWLGTKEIIAKALPDYKGYKAGSYDDKQICEELRNLLSEADIVIAHNGDAFDFRVLNSRFLYHKLSPPAPYKTVDTKKLAKRVARFNSNKLDDLARYFGEGRKIDTTFKLWLGCINGDKDSWAKMVTYNKHDVRLLERIYLRLRPYAKTHPNLSSYQEKPVCPRCGSKHIEWRGYATSTSRKYRRFQCKDCGGWGREAINGKRTSTLTT
jgi:predicted PolB exonuclease-like 3'-5' exonuclease